MQFRIDVTDTACNSLTMALEQLRVYFPEYSVECLQTVLIQWLELSIESLAEDAVFHCVEGQNDISFNRRAFKFFLNKYVPQPISQPDLRSPEVDAASRTAGAIASSYSG